MRKKVTKYVPETLRSTFGFKKLHLDQQPVIKAILLRSDCFILMPSGGGKSLCFQLPALLNDNVTIVISPVKTLILQQVYNLQKLNVSVRHLAGVQASHDVRDTMNGLLKQPSSIKILYVTADKINSPQFQKALDELYQRNSINRFVIDEAHCVSQMGHDFRSDYASLVSLRERFPKVPIVALTATARPQVRVDILRQLNLRDCESFVSGLNRSNIKYMVVPKFAGCTLNIIKTFISSRPDWNGIVYCLSRNGCEEVANGLRSLGISAHAYHADLTENERERRQYEWLVGDVNVMCATVDFGVGINKANVRFVLHYTMPKSIENYYQQTGRAGHDGKMAMCVLYYNYSDVMRIQKAMEQDNTTPVEIKKAQAEQLKSMVRYCENVIDCRRDMLLKYFGEDTSNHKDCLSQHDTACDNCHNIQNYEIIDALQDCRKVAQAVKDIDSVRETFPLFYIGKYFDISN